MKSSGSNKAWIVFLSSYPPRQCGLATFTSDLTKAIDRVYAPSVETKVIAMNVTDVSHLPYSDKVIFQIGQPREDDYLKAAKIINNSKAVKLVSIQHEFGIFGGDYGSHLLLFLKELKKPVVTTFHTVLPDPNDRMLNIVKSISGFSKGIIVMNNYSKELLIKVYGIAKNKVILIPHGIHNLEYKKSSESKTALGYEGKTVLSTFGLMGPRKGIEYVIESLPKVVEKFPNIVYLIAGVTHPVVLSNEGEKYRNFLQQKVYELGLSNHVKFINTYMDTGKLLKFLEATDIYISPSLDPKQTVSGTLSYALGSGRPVVSTAYAHAKESITPEVGSLVDFEKPEAYSEVLIRLVGDNNLREQLGKNAYFRTRHMIWENVALSCVKYFSGVSEKLLLGQKELPPIKLEHLKKLTDSFGMIQFANLSEPDISSGYTLDDNARALIVASLHYLKFKSGSSLKLISTYLNFLSKVSKPNGYFENYIGTNGEVDKKFIDENLQDSCGRALFALAIVTTSKEIPKYLKVNAESLFSKSFRKNVEFSSPRAIAFYTKALALLLTKRDDPEIAAVMRAGCERLMELYDKSRSPEWEWFEQYLTYSNAVIPEALLMGFKITKDERYINTAKKTLEFLIQHTFKDKMHMSIGQAGWFYKGGVRQYFDQQPEDVAASVEALNTMYQITGKKRYRELAYTAFNWFLGDNILGQVVYDRSTGGCYDGVGEKYVNLNQGAESTISYLLARFSFEN